MRKGFILPVALAIVVILLIITSIAVFIAFNKNTLKTSSSSQKKTSTQPTNYQAPAAQNNSASLKSKQQEINLQYFPNTQIIYSVDLGDKVQLYKSTLTNNTILLFEFNKPPRSYDKWLPTPKIQVANDKSIIWDFPTGDKNTTAYIWNGNTTQTIDKTGLLSKNGTKIFNLTYTDNFGTEFSSGDSIINNEFTLIPLINLKPQILYQEKTTAKDGLGTGAYTEYKTVGWLSDNIVLMQQSYHGQLHGADNGLYYFNIPDKTLSKKLDFKGLTFISKNTAGNNFVAKIPDPNCCGGINYGDDQTFVIDQNGKQTNIFDEYSYFNNKDKSEEHYTENAFFSPENNYIAQTIDHLAADTSHDVSLLPPTVLVTTLDGKVVSKKESAKVLGWLDQKTILIKTNVTYIKKYLPKPHWDYFEKSDGMYALDIETGKLTLILNSDFDSAWIL